ncbi:MAG: winged helix-turn-helix transcriptional regulator [Thermoplasmata archaeon]
MKGGHHLRDLRRNTEMLILAELLMRPSARLREIASSLGITVQAVSQYVSEMKREGLLSERNGSLRPTRKGMQMAQEHFVGLKEQVDSVLRRISVIDRCVAIAGKRIKKGQKVGLVMEDGMLMAYPGMKSSSTGVALEDCEEGDDVLVGHLEGIVDLELGELLVLEAPSEVDGGSKTADIRRARERIESMSPGLLVAGDTTGAALLMKASGELFTIHAPVESTMSALCKGVDVVFCGTRESVDRLLAAVADLKKTSGYEIKWRAFKA